VRFWLASGILIAAGVVVAAGQGGSSRSVWDGVYTDAQAVRGEKVSAEHCARCHGPTLNGAEAAPALVGDLFNANWEGVPLGDLLERIRVSMPQDMPGTLSRQQNVDVIAYMLKLGKVPVGTVELVTDSAALGEITFQGKPVADR